MASVTVQPYSGGNDWWANDPVTNGPSAPSPHADAISRIESGGNYRAVGRETGKGRALGKYQVMDFNVGPWTEEVLGQRMTPGQFLNSPEAQEKVFDAKFGSYVEKHGPAGAARAWFAGEGGMNNPNARDVNGMTVAGYERKFNSFAGQGPVVSAAQRAMPKPSGNWWANDPVAEATIPA